MFEFHALKVASVDSAASDATCLTLEIPPALREAYAFHAGQSVIVRRVIDLLEERRNYSVVSAPSSGEFKLGVRLQAGGRMSSELALRVRPGDMLEVATPAGRFRTAVDPGRALSYVAFAAGSGITPVLSLATEILARESHSRFTLIYGNKSIARTMFLEDTLALKNRYMSRFAVHFVMSREPQQTDIFNGRIDAAKVHQLLHHMPDIAEAHEYFVCGPGDMVNEVRAALKGVNPDAPIRFERFASGITARSGVVAQEPQPPSDEVLASIAVTVDGRRRSFPMTVSDASVLAAAERAGIELPFSCRAGICATCRTRVVEGSAVMTHNIALAPWEMEAGFVLCCQARPTTPTLEISYDEK